MTKQTDIIRDYIHPIDLSKLVKACFDVKNINRAFDVSSKKPVGKLEILDFFKKNYELKYEIVEEFANYSETGEKLNYYSKNKIKEIFNFRSKYSSIENIETESKELFKYFFDAAS